MGSAILKGLLQHTRINTHSIGLRFNLIAKKPTTSWRKLWSSCHFGRGYDGSCTGCAGLCAATGAFGQLAQSATEYFIEHLDIIYVSAQNQSQWFKSDLPQLYLVRSGHFDLRSESGELITRLAEGDYFGYPSLLTGEPISNQLEVVQAGLVYVLPQMAFDFLRREYKPFEQYFVRAHAKRLLSNHYKESTASWSERRLVS
ncbi:cyclic nucleotide-binding domain-containing protein [Pseudoalteromonas sp. R3]|uniref:cyclic nucleotide-binding domain-containing protein n=1 Tax=Pseudoalteromonas sp. R3 TaxID=1709477 RepID=UPI001F4E854B|nr:cyclic nucleotide-binding domain-containing protein [Pseudoalteromonas sp. R3]